MRTDPPTGDELARMLTSMRGEVMRTALQDAAEPAIGRAERPGRSRIRGRVVAIAIALVSLLVVGGAGAALAAGIIPNPFDTPPAPAPTVTVTVTASPSSTPTPTPTPPTAPEPVVDPLDTGTWIIDYDRVGDLAAGDPIVPFATAAGFEPNPSPLDCPSGYYQIGSFDEGDLDISVALVQLDARAVPIDDPLLTHAGFSTRTIPEAPLADSPSTPAGIRIGSSEEDLLAAYPGIVMTVSRYDDTIGATTYAAGPVDGRYLVFQVGTSPGGAKNVFRMESSIKDTAFDICD